MSGGAVNVGLDRGGSDEPIRFQTLEDEPGIHVIDAIDRRQYALFTSGEIEPEPVATARIGAPVDSAVRIRTRRITLPSWEAVYVYDHSGDIVTHVADEARSCPANRYLLGIMTQVKLYLKVEAPVRVQPSSDSTKIDFGGLTEVIVGARSLHRRPNGTITTTEDLDDIRAGVSLLSSALKTTSPERTFPTLRGHPPQIALGDEVIQPDHLESPTTGVTLEIHRSLEDLLVVAPLAFFLGAEIAWGERCLRTDDGFVHPLPVGEGFENGIELLLKQTFFLDCLARTEGLHPVDLDERRAFESRFDGGLDFASLYDQPISHRLEAYLDVPYRAIADLIPTWGGSAYVQPTHDAITYLPYLLDTLSTVRTADPQQLEEINGPNQRRAFAEGGEWRSVESSGRPSGTRSHLVLPTSEGSVTRTWVGDGVPLATSKLLASGFKHRLERRPRTGDIRLQVVCNEPEMREERDTVDDVYHARLDHSFDVDVRTDISTEQLRTVLRHDTDFFHFIGHVDRQGFHCADGWLDVEDCTQVGADIFLLNSCRSYEQGEALVQRGSIAGIVTVADLLNHHAATIGQTLARFLHHGFPLYAALDVVRETHRFGDAYALLGDPHTVLSQPTTTFPEYLELRSSTGDRVLVTHQTFPTHRAGVGCEICPPYEEGDRYYLFGGEIETVELDAGELASILDQPTPLRDGTDLRFSVNSKDAP